VLRVKNLHVYYGMIHALRAVSIHVKEKEIVALLGGNGSGKTTLLSAISGVVRPAAGAISFNGREITRERVDRLVRAGIIHGPEGRQIFGPLTVEDNLLLGAYHRFSLAGKAAIRAEVDEIFRLFPVLGERRRQLGGTLSGGEQQMLAIGRALMARPRVLLLDEPSMGLAPMMISQIFSIIAEINAAGTTILLVEQNAAQALSRSDRAYILETGTVTREGPARELLADDSIRAAYLGVA